jgi:inosine-uridine nucleoside N-ribohydrolase
MEDGWSCGRKRALFDDVQPWCDDADDAMAIFFALNSPELDVIGLTTIYGNVQTTTATANAIHLVCSIQSLPGHGDP